MKVVKVSKIEDYLSLNFNNNYIYRGVLKKCFRMIPSLFRMFTQIVEQEVDNNLSVNNDVYKYNSYIYFDIEKISKCIDLECEYLNKIKKYIDQFQSGYNLVSFCQHYGLKTRFLDFTTDIDIALYFACVHWDSNEVDDTDDGKIIVVNKNNIPNRLNEKHDKVQHFILYELLSDPELVGMSFDNIERHKNKDITLFEPYINDTRIENQKGVLIVFPDYTCGNEKLELDEEYIEYEIIIDKNIKRQLVSYLKNKGINSSYIKGESDLSTKKEVLKIIDEFNEKLNNL